MQLEVSDMVFVKLQLYRQHFVLLRKNQNLSLRYFRPFPIIEKIEEVTYKLFSPSAKIHLVFYCAHMKLCKGDHDQPYVPLPITNLDLGLVLQL